MQNIFIISFLFGKGHLYPKQKTNSVAHLEAVQFDQTQIDGIEHLLKTLYLS